MVKIHKAIPDQFELPKRIKRLGELAYNLWWAWNPDAQYLYSAIDNALWDKLDHNPVAFLKNIERMKLNAVVSNRYYLDQYDRVVRIFDNYLADTETWYHRTHASHLNDQVAYFHSNLGCTSHCRFMPAGWAFWLQII